MATNADLQFTNSSANAANTLPTLAGYTQPSLQPYNADTAMYPAINSLAAAAAAYYNASLPASGSQYQQLPGLWPLAGSEPSVTQNVHSNSTAGAGTNGPASTGAGSNNAPNASPNNGAGVNVNANSNSLLYLHGPSAWNPYYAQRSIVNYAAEYSANRRKNATRETTSTLKAWLQEHIKNPYPSKGEKIMLAIITKMTLTQVSTWFANARRRLKKENKMQWSPRQSNEDDDSQPPPPPPAQAAQPEAKQVKLDSASVSVSANVKPASSKLATCKDGAEASCADVNGLSKIWSLAQAASDAKDTQSQLLGFSAANFQAGFSSSSRDALHSLQSLSFGSLPNSSSWSCAMQTAMNASGEGNFGMFKLD